MNISDFIEKEYGSFIGKTIKEIRPMHQAELESLSWDTNFSDIPLVVIFTDNQAWIPSRDPEANGPGFLIAADLTDDLD